MCKEKRIVPVSSAKIDLVSIVNVVVCLAIIVVAPSLSAADWPVHGADNAGTRYSPLTQITADNVSELEEAWVYRTGEMTRRGDIFAQSKDSNIPLKIKNHLIVCTPFNRVISLDAATGNEQWVFDPEIATDMDSNVPYACRGVAYWHDNQDQTGAECSDRLLMATMDLRVFAIDLETGKRCATFGQEGEISLPANKAQTFKGEIRYHMPPTLINDIAVIGSAIDDGHRQDSPSGKIQAIDIRTGRKRWEWDPIPRNRDDPAMATWEDESAYSTGSGNVWGFMAADEERDLLFVPTSSPALDSYGVNRPGRNEYTDSLVALRGSTGEVVWHYQIVHHDLWGHDLASQPLLVDIPKDGEKVPVVVQNTKQGLVFVFNRETGEPFFPIEERPVPKGDIPGEWYSPTQPFPIKPAPLIPLEITPEQAWGVTFWDKGKCVDRIKSHRWGGLYVPPSEKGSLMMPWWVGGANWGGAAFDFKRNWMVINTGRIPGILRLVPMDALHTTQAKGLGIGGALVMGGTPYAIDKQVLTSPFGVPCTAPPWGGLSAVDLVSGEIVWDVPLGTIEELAPLPVPIKWGAPMVGGPIVTASGLIFIAATFDRRFRAFSLTNGEELWTTKLPAESQTTPITYMERGRQFVVITSGGNGQLKNKRGDYVVAYALPD